MAEQREVDDSVLMHRESAGLRVELFYLGPIIDMAAIRVYFDGREAAQAVPNEKALDAFHHPMRYFSESQLATLAVS